MNFDQECFGRPRLIEAMKRAGQMAAGNESVAAAEEGTTPLPEPIAAETVAQHILWELRKFVGMAKPTDDITMIVARIV